MLTPRDHIAAAIGRLKHQLPDAAPFLDSFEELSRTHSDEGDLENAIDWAMKDLDAYADKRRGELEPPCSATLAHMKMEDAL